MTMITLCACLWAKEKVAVLDFEQVNSKASYMKNKLPDDFSDIISASENFELVDAKATEAAMKQAYKDAGVKTISDLPPENITAVGKQLGADVLLWGSAEAMADNQFHLSIKVMGMVTNQYKMFNLDVSKKDSDRQQLLTTEVVGKLSDVTSAVLEKDYALGKKQYDDKDYANAADTFMRLLARDPDNKDYNLYLANIYYQAQRWDKLAEISESIVNKFPEQTDYYGLVAVAYKNLGDFTKAINAYRIYIKVKPSDTAWVDMADIYLDNLKDQDKAVECYKEALKLNAENKKANLQLGLINYDLSKWEEAIPYLEFISNEFPDNDVLAQKLADCYGKSGNNDMAIKNYEDQLAKNPNNTRLQKKLINLYLSTKQSEKALTLLIKLQDSDPSNPAIPTQIANIYYGQSNFGRASEYAHKALKMDDKLFQPYWILAQISSSNASSQYNQLVEMERKANDPSIVGNKKNEVINERDRSKINANRALRDARDLFIRARDRADDADSKQKINTRINQLNESIKATE